MKNNIKNFCARDGHTVLTRHRRLHKLDYTHARSPTQTCTNLNTTLNFSTKTQKQIVHKCNYTVQLRSRMLVPSLRNCCVELYR